MSNPFTPSPDDGAIAILRTVLGKVMDGLVAGTPQMAGNETANMLGEAFRFFNSGVLFFGTIILFYVTVFGVLNTANDGEALGKKWSTFYTPLRTIGSAAALIPTASGYAGIQIMLLMVVTWSVGFASSMWKATVEYSVGQQIMEQAVKSVTDDPNFEALAFNALRMRVCAAGVSKGVSDTLGTNYKLIVNVENTASENMSVLKAGAKTTTYTSTISYKDNNWPGSDAICGKVVLSNTFFAPQTNSQVTADVTRSLQNAIGQIRYKSALALLDGGSGVINTIADEVVQAVEEDGKQISAASIAMRVSAVRVKLMEQLIGEVKKQVEAENSEAARKLSEKGWVYAGSLYREISRIKDSVRNATQSRSEYIPGTGTLETKLSGDVLDSANGILAKYNSLVSIVIAKATVATSAASDRPTVPKIQTSFGVSDFAGGGNGVKTMITAYFNQAGGAAVTGVIHYMSDPEEDPIMRVKNVGDWTATLGESIIMAKITVTSVLAGLGKAAEGASILGAGVSGILGFVISLLAELWSYVSLSVYTLIYAGYFLGIWIPMIPFYIFAVGVVGWLVFVLEMLAAGVLWMAAHTTPAREDSFIGSQTQGYLLVMSGFFRPALMVLGLIASMAILNPAVQYINEGFILAFRSIQADSVTGLLSVAGFLLVYCTIIFAVFMMIFALPQTLPDRILRWIGAGIGDMGEQGTASRVEGAASSQARTAAVAMSAKESSRSRAKAPAANAGENARRAKTDDVASDSANAPEGHSGQSSIQPPKEVPPV